MVARTGTAVRRQAPAARRIPAPALAIALAIAAATAALADEVPAPVIAMFERYVEATESRMRSDRRGGGLLWLDRLPASQRAGIERQLATGAVVSRPLRTDGAGEAPRASQAVFLHAVAVVQVPGRTAHDVVALLRDADHHAEIFAPTIRRSRIVGHDGDAQVVDGQFWHRKVFTIVYNAEVETRCETLRDTQAECRSFSRRGAMVADPGQPTEREKGFRGDAKKQWFLRSYYRVERREDSAFVELETLFVSPPLSRWFRVFTPLVRDVPGEVGAALLTELRARLTEAASPVPLHRP